VIRVLIAEDQNLLREALTSILSHEDDIEVVAEIARGDQVVAAAGAAMPDVALLDIDLPGVDGLVVTAELTSEVPTCRCLILTVFNRPGYLKRALSAGATGFILKDSSPRDLAVAIRRVAAGERVLDPRLVMSAIEYGDNPLTPREREVLQMSSEGQTAGEVARKLAISEGTVRNHLSVAIQKLHAKSKVEAARLAEQRGWL
jgi:two-component system, NarL family, response regulator DesR